MFEKKCVFSGFVPVYELTIPKKDKLIKRYIAGPSDSVFVIVIDPKNKLILLCQEDRYGLPQDEWLQYGTIAGGLKEGEDPRLAGVREAEEETGLILDEKSMIELPSMMASMGVSTEKRYIYIYYTNLVGREQEQHGLESEEENILSLTVTFEDFEKMLLSESLIKEPMLVLGYWYHKLYYK